MSDELRQSNLARQLQHATEEKLARSKDPSGPAQEKAVEEQLHELQVHQIELEMQNEELRRAQLELDAARARYFDLYDLAPLGYLTLSPEGLILEANLAAARLLGAERSTLVKQRMTAFILKEDQDTHHFHQKALFQTGDKQVYELRLLPREGTSCWVHIEAEVGKLGTEETEVCRAALSDITERKRSEEALRERDIRFNKLSSHVPGMIYQFMERPDGTYCVPFTTEAIKDIFGCSPQDVRDDFSLIANAILPEDLAKVVSSIQYSAEHLTPWQCEFRVQIPGQSIRWMFGQSTPEKLAGGGVIWHGFNTDITERKQADVELRESERQYRQLIEKMQDGVYRSSHEGKFLEVNPAMEKILGYANKEELLAIDIKSQLYFAQEDRESAALVEKLEEMGVFRLRKKDGSEIWVEDHGRHVVNNEGTVLYHEGILRDITERKRAEEALRESEAKFRAMVETFPLAIVLVVGIEQVTEYVNPMFVKMFGYSQEDIPTIEQWWPLAYPDEIYRKQLSELWTTAIKHAVETQAPIDLSSRFL